MTKIFPHIFTLCLAVLGASLPLEPVSAQTAPTQQPLFITATAQPAILLNLSRDHKLYYEAYNDATDINGDGIVDVRFTPDDYTINIGGTSTVVKGIDYFGLFDSYKCYAYSGGKFVPTSVTSNKKCSGQWSGDFLNYVTTTRIDALRKVLYGGKRSVDTATDTVLERNYIPQDAHSFGKEYVSVAVNGYDITEYTPLAMPITGTNILFANVTRLKFGKGEPRLRVMTGKNYRLWEWLSIERPVAEDEVAIGVNQRTNVGTSITQPDFYVRVQVCVASLLEQDCRGYPVGAPTVYKPTGVLHEFGENDQMRFGLMSGSYDRNFSGGVLRKNISSFASEIDPNTGQFIGTSGIVKTIDALRVQSFGNNYEYDCGWPGNNKGPCVDWGNPIAEMMYEGLRYLSGKTTPTPAYNAGSGTTSGVLDTKLGLKQAVWVDPFGAGGLPRCSKPVQMVISDIYPSADGDEIPGGFGSFTGDLTGFSASTVAKSISGAEGIPSGASRYFIGESGFGATGDNANNAPTPKSITGFGEIRGLAPDEPSRGGTYYSAAVAHFGKTKDLRPDLPGTQNVDTYAIALASPLPRIQVPTPNGGLVTIVPMGRSVALNGTAVSTPIPNQVVDFYIDRIVNQPGFPSDASVNGGRPYGKFRINFEDVDQGADHDMDAIVEFEYELTATNTVKITLRSVYAAGGYVQHIGYVISGTTNDGAHLRVRDLPDANESVVPWPYGLTPAPAGLASVILPFTSTQEFTPNPSIAADNRFIPQGPLWYAAKWGGFPDVRDKDTNEIVLLSGTNLPAAGAAEGADKRKWDKRIAGEPDNYFLVNNASLLRQQLRRAFLDIQQKTAISAGVANGSVALSADSWSYVGSFNSSDWSGEISGSKLSATGAVTSLEWTTNSTFAYPANSWQDRSILTWLPSGPTGVSGSPKYFNVGGSDGIPVSQYAAFSPNNLFPTLQTIPSLNWNSLNSTQKTAKAVEVITKYVKGDRSLERLSPGGNLRDRTRLLGDIVNSNIVATGNFNYNYKNLPGSEGSSYAAWLNSKRANAATYRTIFVGANDGMMHAINATTGVERFAYVPNAVYPKLQKLLEAGSPHEYTVDGKLAISDAYRSGAWTTVLVGSTGAGGRSVFALDVGSPTGQLNNVLWEFKTPDLGYPLGEPIIGRTADDSTSSTPGKWVAVFANGYYSNLGKATLFILDLFTGTSIMKVDFDIPDSSAPKNGLGAPGALIENGLLKSIYAGDLNGNLWGIELGAGSTSNWKKIAGSKPVFTAKDGNGVGQPISAPPSVSRYFSGGTQVAFGTGKLVVDADRLDSQRQSFYTLHLPKASAIEGNYTRASLKQTTLSVQGDYRYLDKISFTGTEKGWFYDLPGATLGQGGERFLSEPIFALGLLSANSWKPLEDRCAFGGDGWLMRMNALTGSAGEALFDINEDGYVDAWEGKSGGRFASGQKSKSGGSVSAPTINLTIGGATSNAMGTIVASADSCPPGQSSVSIPGNSGAKICRPTLPPTQNGCPAGSEMVTNGTKTSCRPVGSLRQSWTQLR